MVICTNDDSALLLSTISVRITQSNQPTMNRWHFRLISWSLVLILVSRILPSYANPHESRGAAEDLPPILDADDIAYFFERNDLESLHYFLEQVFEATERMSGTSRTAGPSSTSSPLRAVPQQIVSRGGGTTYTAEYKIQHDIEQFEYLLSLSSLDQATSSYLRDEVLPLYYDLLDRIPSLEDLHRTQGLYAFRSPDDTAISKIYNRAHHIPRTEDMLNNNSPLLHPDLDTESISHAWEETGNTIVVVDNLLSEESLQVLQNLLWESTVWFQTKLPLQFGSYVGAYLDDGLHDPVLLQLAKDLYDAVPAIFQGHPLRYLWAYKYDSNVDTGIHLHADQAAVNVNIWLTPEEANLDKESGGLVVYTAKPPASWDFRQYNTETELVREQLLKPTGFSNVTVPYRENRAVIFDSSLFHQTDHCHFRNGYKNRRINLTLLFGTMASVTDSKADEL